MTTAADVIIDENFMKDVIGDLGIDVDVAQLEDIVDQANKPKKDNLKKEDDKQWFTELLFLIRNYIFATEFIIFVNII